MKYAIVSGKRQEAQPGLSGICPCCDSLVIPKCGTVRKPYSAHKSKQMCNSGKESETPWHRAWKDCFPKEWQEIVQKKGMHIFRKLTSLSGTGYFPTHEKSTLTVFSSRKRRTICEWLVF